MALQDPTSTQPTTRERLEQSMSFEGMTCHTMSWHQFFPRLSSNRPKAEYLQKLAEARKEQAQAVWFDQGSSDDLFGGDQTNTQYIYMVILGGFPLSVVPCLVWSQKITPRRLVNWRSMDPEKRDLLGFKSLRLLEWWFRNLANNQLRLVVVSHHLQGTRHHPKGVWYGNLSYDLQGFSTIFSVVSFRIEPSTARIWHLILPMPPSKEIRPY